MAGNRFCFSPVSAELPLGGSGLRAKGARVGSRESKNYKRIIYFHLCTEFSSVLALDSGLSLETVLCITF